MNSLRSMSKRSGVFVSEKPCNCWVAAMGVLLLCLPLFHRASSGRILGTVTDQSGGVVSGATVTVTDTKEAFCLKTLVTNEPGEYNAPTSFPARIRFASRRKGSRPSSRQNVALEVGKEIRVD